MTVDDEVFVVQLKRKLGDNYRDIIVDILSNYALISSNPARLRKLNNPRLFTASTKEELLPAIASLKLDATRPKYFYFKAANVAPKDLGNLTSHHLIKYEAYKLFLEYCKSGGKAAEQGLFSMIVYQPFELPKIVSKARDTFRYLSSNSENALARRGSRIEITDQHFSWIEYEKAKQDKIEDPFEFSKDDEPVLPKPMVIKLPEPPPPQPLEEEIDWTQVGDEE